MWTFSVEFLWNHIAESLFVPLHVFEAPCKQKLLHVDVVLLLLPCSDTVQSAHKSCNPSNKRIHQLLLSQPLLFFFFFTDFKYAMHTESADEEAIYTQCKSRVAFTLIGFFSYCNKYRQHLVPFFWRQCNWKGLLRADCVPAKETAAARSSVSLHWFLSVSEVSDTLLPSLSNNCNKIRI